MRQIRICGSQPFNPSGPNSGRREKIKLNFYFHASCGGSKNLLKYHEEV